MKIIYETPSKEWAIVEQTDPIWESVFGKESVYFNAYRVKDKFLIYSGVTVLQVLNWFRKMNIISEDELKSQSEKIGK